MGFDLARKHDVHNHIHFPRMFWQQILGLALDWGWEPSGTKMESEMHMFHARLDATPENLAKEGCVDGYYSNYHGYYTVNEGQIVTTEDALRLAKALKAALSHGFDYRETVSAESNAKQNEDTAQDVDPNFADYIAEEVDFNEDEKVRKMWLARADDVRELIAFLKCGEFAIY